PKPLSSLNHFTVPVAIPNPPRCVLRLAEDADEATTCAARTASPGAHPAVRARTYQRRPGAEGELFARADSVSIRTCSVAESLDADKAPMPALFVPEERWGGGSWRQNHPLTVDA